MMTLQPSPMPLYALFAGAKSSAGFSGPNTTRRTSAPNDGAVFLPVSYGGCAWDTFGCAGSRVCRSANLRTVAPTSCLAATGDDSTTHGVSPMAQLRLNTLITRSLESRASAHRAMAKSALFADSSARTRLKRYNHHIEKAETLEARALETAKRSAGGVA